MYICTYASVQRDVLRCFPSFVSFKAIARDWLVGTQYYMYRWVYVHRTPSMYTLVGLLFRNKKEQESTKARWFIFMWSPPSTPDTTSYSWNHQPTNREMRKFLSRSLSSSSASSCVWWSKGTISSLVPCVYQQPSNIPTTIMNHHYDDRLHLMNSFTLKLIVRAHFNDPQTPSHLPLWSIRFAHHTRPCVCGRRQFSFHGKNICRIISTGDKNPTEWILFIWNQDKLRRHYSVNIANMLKEYIFTVYEDEYNREISISDISIYIGYQNISSCTYAYMYVWKTRLQNTFPQSRTA